MADDTMETTMSRRSPRDRCTDQSLVAKAANNAALTLASRGAMVVAATVSLFIGGRMLAQLDENTKATAELSKSVAVIAVTVSDMIERVRGLETRERDAARRGAGDRR